MIYWLERQLESPFDDPPIGSISVLEMQKFQQNYMVSYWAYKIFIVEIDDTFQIYKCVFWLKKIELSNWSKSTQCELNFLVKLRVF